MTAPAALHPPLLLAGSMGGIGVCADGMRCPVPVVDAQSRGQGAGLVPAGFCQCTGIPLAAPFISLSSPFPLPSAAAMNLDRIGEHAEAMFGVG